MNEILEVVIKLKEIVQSIQRLLDQSRLEMNGFHRFSIALYIVYVILHITHCSLNYIHLKIA